MISNPNDPPTTVDIIQEVKPGCEEAFEDVLLGLTEAAKTFDGHLGVNVFRPTDSTHPEYRIVFKFDHLSSLQRWENSAIRKTWLQRAEKLTVGSRKMQVLTGLETWFTLPNRSAIVPPPRYKMLVITCIAAFPTLNIINFILQPLLVILPPLLRSLITTAVLLSLMTYVVMPRMTKLFAGWLYPISKGKL